MLYTRQSHAQSGEGSGSAWVLLFLFTMISSGAVIQLVNSTANNTFGEGETVSVCAELVDNGGGLRRTISLPVLLLSGTATGRCVIQLIKDYIHICYLDYNNIKCGLVCVFSKHYRVQKVIPYSACNRDLIVYGHFYGKLYRKGSACVHAVNTRPYIIELRG